MYGITLTETESNKELFTDLWKMKLELEDRRVHLMAQGLDEEAEATWNQIVNVCSLVIYYRKHPRQSDH